MYFLAEKQNGTLGTCYITQSFDKLCCIAWPPLDHHKYGHAPSGGSPSLEYDMYSVFSLQAKCLLTQTFLNPQKLAKLPLFFKKSLIFQKLSCKVFFWSCHMLAKINTVRPRGTRSMCPKKNRVPQNRSSWGLLLFTRVPKSEKILSHEVRAI